MMLILLPMLTMLLNTTRTWLVAGCHRGNCKHNKTASALSEFRLLAKVASTIHYTSQTSDFSCTLYLVLATMNMKFKNKKNLRKNKKKQKKTMFWENVGSWVLVFSQNIVFFVFFLFFLMFFWFLIGFLVLPRFFWFFAMFLKIC